MKNIILAFVFISFTACSQNKTAEKGKVEVKWISLTEAYNRTQKEPRKTIVDVYTDWCGWCKVMDQKTYSNPEIIDYLNKNFYMVKLDAESTKDIMIGTNKYVYDAKSNVHQAAAALLQGKMSYPTTVILDEKYNMIQPIPGYLDAPTMHSIITFFGGNHNTKESFDVFKTKTYPTQYKASISKL